MLFYVLLFSLFIQDTEDIGLNLAELSKLATEVKSVEEFERRLNTLEGDSVLNNVDLNGDGVIDYIHVREKRVGDFDSGSVIFVLEVDDKKIAEVVYKSPKNGAETSEVLVSGEENYYAEPSVVYVHHVHYRYHPFWFRPYWARPIYMSPYRYVFGKRRMFPTYWRQQRVLARAHYRSLWKKKAYKHKKRKLKRAKIKKDRRAKVRKTKKDNVRKKKKPPVKKKPKANTTEKKRNPTKKYGSPPRKKLPEKIRVNKSKNKTKKN